MQRIQLAVRSVQRIVTVSSCDLRSARVTMTPAAGLTLPFTHRSARTPIRLARLTAHVSTWIHGGTDLNMCQRRLARLGAAPSSPIKRVVPRSVGLGHGASVVTGPRRRRTSCRTRLG